MGMGTILAAEVVCERWIMGVHSASVLRRVCYMGIRNARANCSNLGIVGQELRDKQWSKILSLAPMHV